MAEMKRIFLLIGLLCLSHYMRAGSLETETYRFKVKVGSAVNFHLPDVSKCAKFELTDPQDNVVITVYNLTYSEIDRKYAHRSILSLHSNGTMSLALYKIHHGDNGTFLIKPGGQSASLCWRKYLLMTYEDTWSGWSLWSACSEQCGNGKHSRHRYCYRNFKDRMPHENCNGENYQNENCVTKPCTTTPTEESNTNQWESWGPWNSCSKTCGHGVMVRDRRCHSHGIITENQRCPGLPNEERTCIISECEHNGETSPGNISEADEKVIQLPLYSIVGGGAGVFILVLIIVICVLVIKLKKKGSFKKGKPPADVGIRKQSNVSFSSQGVSGVHVYDEIDDVKSNRMSVLTIDNPYVTMPKSPKGSVVYSNMQEKVFVFDSTTTGGQYENRNVACTYQNVDSKPDSTDGNKLTVPRHMSVDSTGYLMPGTTLERAAARRQKKYLK